MSAYYHKKTGAPRCCKNPVHCPSLTKKGHDVGQIACSIIDPKTGLSPRQIGGVNAIKKFKNDGSFKEICQKGGQASSDKKRKQIMPDGRNMLQYLGHTSLDKRRKTVLPSGKTISENHAQKAANTRRTTVLPNGLTMQEDINRRVNIDKGADGLSKSERGLKKALKFKQFGNTEIMYQGTYELSFLDGLLKEHGEAFVRDNVRRGRAIKYTDSNGKKRNYFPDFVIGNDLYEVKSSWTLQVDLEKNRLKLEAACKHGFNVYLVVSGIVLLVKE